MATATLDFGAFTTTELNTMLTAAKAEILTRMTGRVSSGSSSGQQFGMTTMSYAELTNLINGLTVQLGYEQPEVRVAPNFSGSPGPFFVPAAAVSPSRLEPNVGSWADLQALSTTGYPDNTIKIWVETDSGLTKAARLLPSTDPTNPSLGAYRPNDYADPGNARVWFQSAPI